MEVVSCWNTRSLLKLVKVMVVEATATPALSCTVASYVYCLLNSPVVAVLQVKVKAVASMLRMTARLYSATLIMTSAFCSRAKPRTPARQPSLAAR